jgi:5-methyltetrahydrofolate--homocysteine methyltransferase
MDLLLAIANKTEKGKQLEVPQAVQQALGSGISPYEVLTKGLQAGLEAVGARFKRNQAYIPEVLLAARAMQAGMEVLQPLLAESGAKPIAKVVFGTVKDDMHDIGKNMVVMMLEGSGFQVVDLGVNVPAEKFVATVEAEKSALLAMSALLSTTAPYLKTVIEALKEKGLRQNVKVLVGGAPVTEEYAIEIGADGFAPDSARAVDKAKELLNDES